MNTTSKWLVGYLNETCSREVRQCPSYYAADWEVLRTREGRYPVYMDWRHGYTCPMVGDFHVGIAADRVDGMLYSGFCGNNFASNPLPKEPVTLCVTMYQFNARKANIDILPGMEWLFAEDFGDVVAQCKSMTWDDVRQLDGDDFEPVGRCDIDEAGSMY